MSQSIKLLPNLDEKTTKVLNLTVLQRIDPFVEEILLTAAHVTFYEFNIENSQWGRKDVEGSLFVVKRNAQPRFQFIVMNRRNTDNLVEDLLGDFEYEVQVPYLLYRNASREVNGIWFYNARECEDVANLFTRILSAYAKVPAKSKVPSPQSEFKELEAVPTLAVMDGPLEPPRNVGVRPPDDPSFVNFFSTAMNLGGVAASSKPYLSTPTSNSGPYSQAVPQSTTPNLLTFTQWNSGVKLSTDHLVKPTSLFSPPVSSSMPSAPPLNLPVNNTNIPYGGGAPLLQPFPPPTPSLSLNPTSVPPESNCPPLRREHIQQVLQSLVQDDQFIDMVYRALVNAQQPSLNWK